MARKSLFVVLSLVAAVLILSRATAEDPPAHKYVGTKKCKMCHQKPEQGEQFKIWSESKHAKAWEVLATPEAKAAAEKKGIAGNPQEAPECLKCHVTAFGVAAEFLDKDFDPKQGIQCEACHGPGGDYWKKETMKDKAAAEAAGLVKPTEEHCKKCHNEESPNYKEFKFEEFKAKIAHPVPSK